MQAIDVEIQELAVAARGGDRESVQRRHGRIERLDRAEGRDVDSGDDSSDGPLPEEGRERFDFR